MKNKPYIDRVSVERAFYAKIRRIGLIHLELTERCNNNCRHCYINRPHEDPKAIKKELSTNAVKKYLAEFASFGWFVVRFTGGEPLLRDDFEELYISARELGFKVVLSTNATLITERLAGLFKRMPLLEEVDVTLYGMRRASYESVTRVPGSFDAAMRGISLLRKNKIPFLANLAVLSSNKNDIPGFRKWFSKIFPANRYPVINASFDLHIRRNPLKNDCIRNIRFSPEESLRVLPPQKPIFIMNMRAALQGREPGRRLFSCGAGKGGLCLDPYGKLYPCVSLRHPETEYDLKNGSIGDAYNRFFPAMRRRSAGSVLLARCSRCFLKPACGQCPGKSWMENGDLRSPAQYFCGKAHAQAVYFGLLREGEKSWEVKDWRARVKKFLKGEMNETDSGIG